MSLIASPPPNASATVRGLVSLATQTFAGAKTFLAVLIASAGIQLASLFNNNGGGGSDVGVKVGVSTADASVSAGAKVLSVRTGIGGTEGEYVFVRKDYTQIIASSAGAVLGLQNTNASGFAGVEYRSSTNTVGVFTGYKESTGEFRFNNIAAGGYIDFMIASTTHMRVTNGGRLDQAGTDSTGSPGAATINKPTGKSAIANGATTVVITNNLVATGSRVMVTWHGDHGAARWWVVVGSGSFTVTLSAAAGANTSFSWQVSTLL